MMVELPITKGCGIRLKGAFNSFYFEIEFRKNRTTKGMQCASLNVQLSTNSSTKYPQMPSLVSTSFSFQFGADRSEQHCRSPSSSAIRQQCRSMGSTIATYFLTIGEGGISITSLFSQW